MGDETYQEWTGVQLFVGDALMYSEGSQQCYNFFMKSDTLNMLTSELVSLAVI